MQELQELQELQQAPGVTETPQAPFDIVIAGGGMTGALLALLVSQRFPKLRLAVIEQQAQHQAPAVSFDSRSIALSRASISLLDSFGLWPQLKPHASAIDYIQVSDRGHAGKTRLKAADYQLDALGYVIEIEWIGQLLYQQLAQYPAIAWYRPDQIREVSATKDRRRLSLQSGAELECKLLILCEGGDSPSRALCGVGVHSHDYQQTALIANIGLKSPHQQQAFERFTSKGPLALLPLSRQRYSLVWTTNAAEAARLAALDEPAFLAELQQFFGYRAGEFSTAGNRVLYPLRLKTAEAAAAHRLLLCGNSLHNLHPIAGQGFNLALRDLAAVLSLLALHAPASGGQNSDSAVSELRAVSDHSAASDHSVTGDVGCYALTRAYQQVRTADMQQVVTMTDSLVRLFSNDSKLLALGRTLGLTLLDHCAPLKQAFASQSMGLSPLLTQQQTLAALAPRPISLIREKAD